jgi:hypothetical protein
MLKNGLLRVIMITHDSNEEIKYDVFMRLNTGSVHLTEQELRNCLYRGNLNKLLKDFSQNKIWQTLLGLNEPHKRMADRELALRFLAIYKNWDTTKKEIAGYKGRMKSFLNSFMCSYQNIDNKISLELKQTFEETIEKVLLIYGEDAFRRISSDGIREKSINRAIMDIIMLSSTQFTKDDLLRNKDDINQHLFNLITTDADFGNSIKNGTSDTKVIIYRLARWCDELNSIISI